MKTIWWRVRAKQAFHCSGCLGRAVRELQSLPSLVCTESFPSLPFGNCGIDWGHAGIFGVTLISFWNITFIACFTWLDLGGIIKPVKSWLCPKLAWQNRTSYLDWLASILRYKCVREIAKWPPQCWTAWGVQWGPLWVWRGILQSLWLGKSLLVGSLGKVLDVSSFIPSTHCSMWLIQTEFWIGLRTRMELPYV